MATLNVKLELISRGFGTPTKISVRDRIRTTNPSQGLSRVSATTTGGDTIILPSESVERFVYIRHLGLDSAGKKNITDKLKVEYSDGNHIAELRAGEFLYLPYDTGGAALLQLEASANTIQAEYAFFTRS
tara:strand:- start:2 stop:391 length:390 start_codon:yes stop_codon:yes gene_type:complete